MASGVHMMRYSLVVNIHVCHVVQFGVRELSSQLQFRENQNRESWDNYPSLPASASARESHFKIVLATNRS